MRERARGFRWQAAALLAGLALGWAASGQSQQPRVDKLVLDDTIQPVSAGMLQRALKQANADGSAALLVELNTPGGLLDSTREMAGAILSSHVPVIVYVAPAGSRAGSAGFFLLEAADVAAMAPGTNAGASHPVLEFGKMDSTENEKVVNDAEAFLRSYVTRRGRDATAAQAAVQSSHSYTAEEALSAHLIDVIAPSETQLFAECQGRTITRMDGTKQTLNLAGAKVVTLRESLREELLGWLVDPNVALLMLVVGALLIYLEFNTPGTIVPGTLGTVLVLLAIFGLNLLPIRYTAVLLLVAGMALLVMEAKFGGHGALAVGGIVSLTFGMLTLVAAPVPQMGVSPLVAIGVSLGFGGITVFLVRLAVRARRRKAMLGADAMVGRTAEAMEALRPEGHVLVEGEIWLAVASEPVAAGARLRVVGQERYRLRVEPAEMAQTTETAT
ncbi:MAG: nodulation protein NfeD [Terracidiphilus sp.]